MIPLLLLALATAAPAEPRPAGAERQAVSDLAYALGEMHALTRTCLGETEQSWRERMNRLLALELPANDEAGRRSLIERFNAGFALARAEHPACTPEAEAGRQAAARRGLVLARQLGAP